MPSYKVTYNDPNTDEHHQKTVHAESSDLAAEQFKEQGYTKINVTPIPDVIAEIAPITEIYRGAKLWIAHTFTLNRILSWIYIALILLSALSLIVTLFRIPNMHFFIEFLASVLIALSPAIIAILLKLIQRFVIAHETIAKHQKPVSSD
ncbi:hypothetical protein JD969_14930 [Planctomycetota bacterium]|nr:hypothetical protein JD969_14930 [Planctomycetota bacterium]